MARLSCHRFRSSEVRLWLSLIAHNGGICGGGWCCRRLVKTGGRLVKHARYYWLMLAESHVTRRLFRAMVRRMEALPAPAG